MFLTKATIPVVLLVIWATTTKSNKPEDSVEVIESIKCGLSRHCECPKHPKLGTKKYHMEKYLRRNWHGAYMHCRSRGWRLATVNNMLENSHLVAYVEAMYPNHTWLTNDDQFWVSGTELGKIGTWKWMSSGDPIEFFYWDKDQPNHYLNNQHCLSYYDLHYNDYDCSSHFMFVCECFI